MAEAWIPLTIFAAVVATAGVATAGLYLLTRRPVPFSYANLREERLTRKLAQMVGCSPAQALPAVRREVNLAPNQSDDTLVKRAAYHYRQELPEPTGYVYRDQAPG